MTQFRPLLASALLSLLTACSTAGPDAGDDPGPSSARHLAAYADEAELTQALDRWRAAAARMQAEHRRAATTQAAPQMSAPAAAPAPAAVSKTAESAAASDGITNVQTAGVDEGGIVKRAGDFLVVLRRGRLFTLRVGADALQPVAWLDAYAPGADPRGAWYDELLVSGSTVVVVGYSYARGGTEIGLFELDARGGLRYRATHHLRSFDYYSARNYASRLVGTQLVFYSPTLLQAWGPHPLQLMPGQRRWSGQTAPPGDPSWQRILPATRIFRSDDDFDPAQPLALHTVTRCDLAAADLRCESSAVLGPAGRVFYVSTGSVYVWAVGRARRAGGAPAALFRMPLDGSAPSGIKTVGVPIDQLSFLEDRQGYLNVLLRAEGAGEGMWGSRQLRGDTALLRLPLSALGHGGDAAQRHHYRLLPARQTTHNRYVGDWLLMGSSRPPVAAPGRGGAPTTEPAAWAIRYADPAAPALPLAPGHAVERIEALGAHALLVGNAGADLHLSPVRLEGHSASLAGSHVQPGARQGETRSHGYYYQPTGADTGLIGLPVVAGGGPRGGIYRGTQGAASVLYLRNQALAVQALGALQSRPTAGDDGCRASCVDWYGNARPLFLDGRVFALLGYEVVEGRIERRQGAHRLDERRRVSFAPQLLPGDGGRHSPFAAP
jgi:hypothetical protein